MSFQVHRVHVQVIQIKISKQPYHDSADQDLSEKLRMRADKNLKSNVRTRKRTRAVFHKRVRQHISSSEPFLISHAYSRGTQWPLFIATEIYCIMINQAYFKQAQRVFA